MNWCETGAPAPEIFEAMHGRIRNRKRSNHKKRKKHKRGKYHFVLLALLVVTFQRVPFDLYPCRSLRRLARMVCTSGRLIER